MVEIELISIDAETPLSKVVEIAARDIEERGKLPMPMETEDVYALCAWGKLLNSVAKDHGKMFEERLNKLPLSELEKYVSVHPVTEQAKAMTAEREQRGKAEKADKPRKPRR